MKTLDNKAENNPTKKGPDRLDENELNEVAGGMGVMIGPAIIPETLGLKPGQGCDINTMEMKPGQPIGVTTLETKPETGLGLFGLFKSKKRGKRKATASPVEKTFSI